MINEMKVESADFASCAHPNIDVDVATIEPQKILVEALEANSHSVDSSVQIHVEVLSSPEQNGQRSTEDVEAPILQVDSVQMPPIKNASLNPPERNVASNPDSGMGTSPVSPQKDNSQQRFESLRADLLRLAQLRMIAMQRRSVLNQEGTHIRLLNSQTWQDVRKLVENMKEKLPSMWPDSSFKEDVLFANWEDCLIEIEDSTYKSEEVGKKLDQQIKSAIEADYLLCDLEYDLYEQNGDAKSPIASNSVRDFTPSDAQSRPHLQSQQVTSTSLNANEDPERLLPINEIQHSPDPALGLEDNDAISAETHDGYEGVEIESEGSTDIVHRVESAIEPQVEEFDAQQAQFEDTAGNGFQFVDHHEAAFSNTDSAAGLATNGYTENDFDNFTRYILYGTPWYPRWATDDVRSQGAFSDLNFIRAWLTHTLFTICSGKFALPHHQSAEDENNIFKLPKYVLNWMWDPTLLRRSTLPADRREPSRENLDTNSSVEVTGVVFENQQPGETPFNLPRSDLSNKGTVPSSHLPPQAIVEATDSIKFDSEQVTMAPAEPGTDASEIRQPLSRSSRRPASETFNRDPSGNDFPTREESLSRSKTFGFTTI